MQCPNGSEIGKIEKSRKTGNISDIINCYILIAALTSISSNLNSVHYTMIIRLDLMKTKSYRQFYTMRISSDLIKTKAYHCTMMISCNPMHTITYSRTKLLTNSIIVLHIPTHIIHHILMLIRINLSLQPIHQISSKGKFMQNHIGQCIIKHYLEFPLTVFIQSHYRKS